MVFYVCRYGRDLQSYPSPSLDGDKSIRFQKQKVSTTTKENQCQGSFGIKTIRGWCACTKWVWEYGAVRIPSTILKNNFGCGLYPHSQLWNSWSGFARRRWIGNLFTQTFITKGGGCYGIWFFRKLLPCNLYIHHADHLRPQRQH